MRYTPMSSVPSAACQRGTRRRAKSLAAARASSSGSACVIAHTDQSFRLNARFANHHAVFPIFLGDQVGKLLAVAKIDRHSQCRHARADVGHLVDLPNGLSDAL